MVQAARLLVNAPQVIFDLFENEVVVVHLQQGTYFSLRGGSAALWRALLLCPELTLVRAALADASENSAAVLEQADECFSYLLQHELVRESSEEVQISEDVRQEVRALFAGPGAAPSIEAIERFTDMQELLALDPIHETGDDGWPVRN